MADQEGLGEGAGPSRRSTRIRGQQEQKKSNVVTVPVSQQAKQTNVAPVVSKSRTKPAPPKGQHAKTKEQKKAKKSVTSRTQVVLSEVSEELVDDPVEQSDGTPVPLSGASLELPHSSVKQQRQKAEPGLCEICQKVLSSKSRLKEHVMRHRIQDINSRKIVSFDNLCLETKACDILKAMSKDRGEGKKEFIDEIISYICGEGFEEWKQFVTNLIKPMVESFIMRGSALPSQQYEDQHRALNLFLNDESDTSNFLTLLAHFKKFCNSSDDKMARNVFTRLCFLLLNTILQYQFEAMKAKESQIEPNLLHSIDKDDFEVHIRKYFQMYYMKGVKSASTRMLARCACIRMNFIDAQCDLDSVELITNNASWQKDVNGIAKLRLKERVIEFFLSVEEIIRSFTEPTADDVFNVLLERNILLEPWYLLTTAFGEEEALIFLSDLIPSFIKLSLRLRNRHVRESQGAQKIGQYALNMGLKRN